MKKVYVVTQYKSTDIRAIVATLDKAKKWLLSYCDYLMQDAYRWYSEDVYLQEKEHYTQVKEYFEKHLKRYTEETFDVGRGIYAYGFGIECVEVIE